MRETSPQRAAVTRSDILIPEPKLPVLVNGRIGDEILLALAAAHEVAALSPDELSGADAARIRVVVTMGIMRTDRALLGRLPALGLVCCTGSGYEGVDLAAARERGIAVTHGPDTNASAVADLAMALLLAVTRGVVTGDRFVRDGSWNGLGDAALPLATGLAGRKVGIFGLGTIGLKIALRLAAFETTIGYCNRHPRSDVPYRYVRDLAALAHWADILIVAVRAGPGNRHAVDAGTLAALGSDGFLVNIARGSVVDEAALVAALEAGSLAGAGLDVFEDEPRVPPGLIASRKVVLTPHIGGATRDAHFAMADLVLRNIDAFRHRRPLLTPVPGA